MCIILYEYTRCTNSLGIFIIQFWCSRLNLFINISISTYLTNNGLFSKLYNFITTIVCDLSKLRGEVKFHLSKKTTRKWFSKNQLFNHQNVLLWIILTRIFVEKIIFKSSKFDIYIFRLNTCAINISKITWFKKQSSYLYMITDFWTSYTLKHVSFNCLKYYIFL